MKRKEAELDGNALLFLSLHGTGRVKLRILKLTSSSRWFNERPAETQGQHGLPGKRRLAVNSLSENPQHIRRQMEWLPFPQLVQKIKGGSMKATGLWVTDTFLSLTTPRCRQLKTTTPRCRFLGGQGEHQVYVNLARIWPTGSVRSCGFIIL